MELLEVNAATTWADRGYMDASVDDAGSITPAPGFDAIFNITLMTKPVASVAIIITDSRSDALTIENSHYQR